MTRSLAATAPALVVKAADAEIATVAATETDLASLRATSLLRVQPRRPRLTVAENTSARQPRAPATATALAAAAHLHSPQKLENPGQWSGFLLFLELRRGTGAELQNALEHFG